MKADMRTAWLTGLRSGGYSQIRGQFKDAGGYCCLGVLSETCNLGVINEYGFSVEDGYETIAKVIGRECQDLWELNDRRKWSFAKIADWIEANIPAEA